MPAADRPAKPTTARKSRAAKPVAAAPADGAERLHKVLAQAGIGSRRACELLILEGRVTVDGEVVRELGTKVDPKIARIAVDGQRIHPEEHVYYLVYKPKGYVSTSDDPSGRPLVLDLVPKARERIFIVGRLDRHSEGLMLLTNDGSLAQRLTHPSYGVEKTYRVTVAGDAGHEVISKLTEGVWLAEGKVRARRARVVARRGNVTVLEVVLAEGKNREIRRMLARLEHKVLSLVRVSIGPLQLKGLSEGGWRSLSEDEVERLRTTTKTESFEEKRPKRPGKPAESGRGREERPRDRSDDRGRSEAPRGRSEGRYGRTDDRGRSEGPRGRSAAPGRSRSDSNEGGRGPRFDRSRLVEPRREETEAEEIVFTDRMDMDIPPSKRPSGSRPDGAQDRPRGDRPPMRPRGKPQGGPPRSDGGSGERRGGSRDSRPPESRRTIIGQSREPEKGPPKRRSGPSRGLPPRRRKPKG